MHKDKQQHTDTQERERHEQDTMKKSSPEDMSGAQKSQEKKRSDAGAGVNGDRKKMSYDSDGNAFSSDNRDWKNDENKGSSGKLGSRGGDAGSDSRGGDAGSGGMNKGQSGNMGNKDRRSGL